jgi:hypothetical protein
MCAPCSPCSGSSPHRACLHRRTPGRLAGEQKTYKGQKREHSFAVVREVADDVPTALKRQLPSPIIRLSWKPMRPRSSSNARSSSGRVACESATALCLWSSSLLYPSPPSVDVRSFLGSRSLDLCGEGTGRETPTVAGEGAGREVVVVEVVGNRSSSSSSPSESYIMDACRGGDVQHAQRRHKIISSVDIAAQASPTSWCGFERADQTIKIDGCCVFAR